MATWAIGDVQGCAAALRRLLHQLELAPTDRLWFVGDLVNRGPDNLGVLRDLMARGEQVTAVLGNHDLHLLGCAAGHRRLKKKDTIQDVLSAPDREALLAWLRARPLLHRERGFVMVHAGLHPAWSMPEAEAHARRLEALLRGGRFEQAEADEAYAVLTRIRFVDEAGEPDFGPKCGPPEAPHLRPWFMARERADAHLVFGHWAALGLHLAPGVSALDTGCVWGQSLTAWCLEDGRVVSVPASSPRTPAGLR